MGPSGGRRPELSEAQEDYLKQILLLGGPEGSVSTQQLAERLTVRPASVTGMVQRLAGLGLLRHARYRGVRLTEAGRRVALELVRHHRLLETYLARTLGYPWEEIHAEAERLEHVISEGFEARIAELLDHPSHDPHGDPIPDADLVLPPEPETVALTEAATACPLRLVRVTSQDPETLAQVAALGLRPGHVLRVFGRSRAGLRVAVAGHRATVPRALAARLRVEIAEAEPVQGGPGD
jgi:DtxR family transcriptional regulator, Mn-dependent transcriptional regulator